MKPQEVGSSTKVAAFGDEHLLGEIVAANDHAFGHTQLDLVDVAVFAGHASERFEGSAGMVEPVKATDHRKSSRSAQNFLADLAFGGDFGFLAFELADDESFDSACQPGHEG